MLIFIGLGIFELFHSVSLNLYTRLFFMGAVFTAFTKILLPFFKEKASIYIFFPVVGSFILFEYIMATNDYLYWYLRARILTHTILLVSTGIFICRWCCFSSHRWVLSWPHLGQLRLPHEWYA
jgi:hypothetical protein